MIAVAEKLLFWAFHFISGSHKMLNKTPQFRHLFSRHAHETFATVRVTPIPYNLIGAFQSWDISPIHPPLWWKVWPQLVPKRKSPHRSYGATKWVDRCNRITLGQRESPNRSSAFKWDRNCASDNDQNAQSHFLPSAFIFSLRCKNLLCFKLTHWRIDANCRHEGYVQGP